MPDLVKQPPAQAFDRFAERVPTKHGRNPAYVPIGQEIRLIERAIAEKAKARSWLDSPDVVLRSEPEATVGGVGR